MSTTHNSGSLHSHSTSPENIESRVNNIRQRIIAEGDKPGLPVTQQLEILQALAQSDFGAYLLLHQGLNGYWTHYMLTFPWFGRKKNVNNRGDSLNDMENFLLNRAPTMLATQQRFEIFLRENQKAVKNNAKLACIPSGLLGELLYLNYDNISSIELMGIDYDRESLALAESLAKEKNLEKFITLSLQDAWHLKEKNEFDLISSNGLNIYVPEEEKVEELYAVFYNALKPQGKLVTSFLTPPPTVTNQCEWDFSQLNQKDLMLQKIIMIDIIQAKFQSYTPSEKMQKQLEKVGFHSIEFYYDKARLFPTVVAYK